MSRASGAGVGCCCDEPHTDFGINATGSINLLEATRQHSPEAIFIFMSANKIYGDPPNRTVGGNTRWELSPEHAYAADGIDETMTVDQCLHSLFGASKLAANVDFGMRTVCFRGGCLPGFAHSGAELHGFLAYLVKCAVTDIPYTVIGYKGKQVRDNLHVSDLVSVKTSRGRVWKLALGGIKLAATAACFWYVVQSVNVSQVVLGVAHLELGWASLVTVILLAQTFISAVRWSAILRALDGRNGRTTQRALIAATTIGTFFAKILPSGASQGVSAWLLIRLDCDRRKAISSVVIDRAVGVGLLML